MHLPLAQKQPPSPCARLPTRKVGECCFRYSWVYSELMQNDRTCRKFVNRTCGDGERKRNSFLMIKPIVEAGPFPKFSL